MTTLMRVALLSLLCVLPLHAAPSPDALVRQMIDEVLAAIRDHKDLREFAEQNLVQRFDFAEMTRLACGRSCRQATPEQKAALERAFRALLVRTYAAALSSADASRTAVDIGPFLLRPGDNDVSVRTLVRQPGRQAFSIEYRLALGPDGWKAYDVLVEGISIVTNYRSQFADEINRSGIDGLIRALRAKTGG